VVEVTLAGFAGGVLGLDDDAEAAPAVGHVGLIEVMASFVAIAPPAVTVSLHDPDVAEGRCSGGRCR